MWSNHDLETRLTSSISTFRYHSFSILFFFNYSQSLYQPRDILRWYFKRIRVVIKKGKADVTEKAYFFARNLRMSWLNLFCGSPRYDKFSPFPVSRCNNHLLSSWAVPIPMDEVATRFYSRSPGDQWDSSTSGLSLIPRGKMSRLVHSRHDFSFRLLSCNSISLLSK